ncbi:MAG: FAD-binding protein, partial [Oscillospiraceae bacterium]|nr:FAD-binding protein [Oscillospiraceae bacterium]
YIVYINSELTARADWYELEEKYRMFRTAHIFDVPEGSPLKKERWNAQYFMTVVYESALALGVRFMFKSKAEQLIKENGRVCGVIVKDENGYKKLTATKGVILATGGITDSDEMKECFCPIALRVDKNENFPVGGNNGDGLVMGKWVGGAFSRCYPAPIIHPVNFTPLGQGMNTSWLTVDRNGRRFCNEMAYEPIVTNARLNAPGNVAWSIWDSDMLAHFAHQEPLKYKALPENAAELIEECVKNGEYIKCDTLEELAEAIGVPAANLAKTVDRYNEICETGDDVDFGVPERFLSPVRKGPFYAGKINAWLLNLPYGLHVNDNSQVCSNDDEAIPGLYAVGNVQGDFFANSYPVTLPGTSHGRSICFGRLVGSALALGKNIDGTDID